MKALVTGATGMVGSHLVERLVEREDEVRTMVRDLPRAEFLSPPEVELVQGALEDAESLERAAQGVEIVYHCAARVALPYQGNREEIFRANVEGTKNILEASVRVGVRRFVFVSSVAVYGDIDEPIVREDHPLQPRGPYAESKVLAEGLVRDFAARGLETVILRPCVIYGPRDRNFLPQIIETLPRRPFPLVGGGRQPLDMVYASDVAEALMLAGASREAVGRVYNVTDGETHTLRGIIEVFSRIVEVRPKLLVVPYPIAYALAAVSFLLSKLLRPGEDPLISPAAVAAMAKPHHYDISRIQQELGYEPQVSLEDGMRMAVDWYRDWKGQRGREVSKTAI
jgi:nucleoside-diphosphate-sugar epimerase